MLGSTRCLEHRSTIRLSKAIGRKAYAMFGPDVDKEPSGSVLGWVAQAGAARPHCPSQQWLG